MIAPEPFLEPRGTPISVHQRMLGLAELGHEVHLLAYHVGQDVVLPPGAELHRIPRVPFVKRVKVGPSWSKPLLDMLVLAKAMALMARIRYDVIHSHEEAVFFSSLLARLFGCRHVYDMHSCLSRQLAHSAVWGHRPVARLFEMLEKRIFSSSDAIITIAADLEATVRAANPAASAVTIDNLPVSIRSAGIDPQRVQSLRCQLGGPERVFVVYTGTFERYQGLELLLESAVSASRARPQVKFVLVGAQSHQLQSWQERVRGLGLQDHVAVLERVSPDESLAFQELADILVSPRIAGLTVPLKIYSYLWGGKPIVATDIDAHTAVLDHQTALLVPPDSAALAAGIVQLMDDPELRQGLGTRAQQYAAQNHVLSTYLAKLKLVYDSLEEGQVPMARFDARPAGESS